MKLAFAGAAASIAMLAMSSPAPATTAAKKPDLTGVWIGWEKEDTPAQYRNTPYPNPPSFTAEGRKWSQYWGDPTHNLGVQCIPWGGPAGVTLSTSLFPMEIIQKDKQVTIINEFLSQTRRVYLDGRGHPQRLEKTWFGHSIGHWERDTLVIDTVGVHHGPLNGSGTTVVSTDAEPRMPYSESLHLTERLRVIDRGDILQDVLTVDDPAIYTRPFQQTRLLAPGAGIGHPRIRVQREPQVRRRRL